MLPLIEIPRIDDDRGSLCIAERLPFQVRRVYWIFDIQRDSMRGGHAHKSLHRWLVALSGSFTVRLDRIEEGRLYRPDRAIYVAPMRWLELADFSHGAVCLVFASEEYDAADYIRDIDEWRSLALR